MFRRHAVQHFFSFFFNLFIFFAYNQVALVMNAIKSNTIRFQINQNRTNENVFFFFFNFVSVCYMCVDQSKRCEFYECYLKHLKAFWKNGEPKVDAICQF